LAVVFRERKFTVANSLLLGLCVGVSFLLRSPLALFPPAVLLFDFLRGRYRKPRTALAHFAALFFFPVLFLLPWIYMNASAYGKFVPFEGERGYRNVVAGAAGLSMTAEGDTYAMAGIPETSNPALHLARRMISAPGTVFPAAARRAWLAYSWHPVLWTLALVSMLLLWRRPGTAGLALLCLYYAGLYCVSMPLEPRYILPLAPVLFGLACMLFGDTDAAPSPGPALVLSALLAPLLLGSAFAAYLAAAYPSRIGRTASELYAKHPSSGFLALMAAKEHAAQGDYLNALPFAALAVRLEPWQLRWRQQYLGLLAGSGVDVSRAAAYGPQSRGRRVTASFLLLDSASLLDRGEYMKAEIKLAQARAYWDGGFVMLRGRLDARGRALERRLWEGDSGFYMSELAGIARLRPPQARAQLAARLARITELPQGFARYCGAVEDNGRD
ncbi:MAG: hypothetical protein GX410_03140, partial [Elusimicrobia bacterium]|nr:hypothetical protein [Elusimicrobiota bacterium]